MNLAAKLTNLKYLVAYWTEITLDLLVPSRLLHRDYSGLTCTKSPIEQRLLWTYLCQVTYWKGITLDLLVPSHLLERDYTGLTCAKSPIGQRLLWTYLCQVAYSSHEADSDYRIDIWLGEDGNHNTHDGLYKQPHEARGVSNHLAQHTGTHFSIATNAGEVELT